MTWGRGRGRATIREMSSQQVSADDQAANGSPPANNNETAPAQLHVTADEQNPCGCGMCGTLVVTVALAVTDAPHGFTNRNMFWPASGSYQSDCSSQS